MENVLVENSRFYSTCNAIKFGTDSQGDARNVLVRNVEVGGPAKEMRALKRRLPYSAFRTPHSKIFRRESFQGTKTPSPQEPKPWRALSPPGILQRVA